METDNYNQLIIITGASGAGRTTAINVFEDGLQSRDFVFIDDVVDATILGLESEIANNNAYNVGSWINTSVLKVANKLKELYDSDAGITISGNYRLGDIRHNYADLKNISLERLVDGSLKTIPVPNDSYFDAINVEACYFH